MLEHPFAPDMSDLTVDQLSEKISEMRKKLFFAHSINNQQLVGQIQLMLNSYQNAYHAALRVNQQKNTIKIS